jgi:ubiquitin C-terminal hydrolase
MKNPMFKSSQQQDAHEAFSILIEMMHMEIAQKIVIHDLPDITKSTQSNSLVNACVNFWSKEYSPLYNIFHSMYLNTRVCSSCGTKSETYEPNLFLGLDLPKPGTKSKVHESLVQQTNPFVLSNYINIVCKIPSVQIPEETKQAMCGLLSEQIVEQIKEKHSLITDFNARYDLADCIDDFINSKQIDNFQCEGCGNKCSCVSTTRMVIPPKTLCVHIKRFSSFLTKRSNFVSFPENLDISSILQDGQNQSYNTKYKLKAVINHAGSNLNFGHYYTYAYSNIHEKWYNFNDENVMEMNLNYLCTPNAYLLFYELDE